MVIPKQMKIGKHRYKIKVVPQMPTKGDMGRTHYGSKEIMLGLATNPGNDKYMEVEINETFWHEVTHAILFEMNSPLAFNERFVDQFGFMLSKAIHTAKFK